GQEEVEAGVDEIAQFLGVEDTSGVMHQVRVRIEGPTGNLLLVVLADEGGDLFPQPAAGRHSVSVHDSARSCTYVFCSDRLIGAGGGQHQGRGGPGPGGQLPSAELSRRSCRGELYCTPSGLCDLVLGDFCEVFTMRMLVGLAVAAMMMQQPAGDRPAGNTRGTRSVVMARHGTL